MKNNKKKDKTDQIHGNSCQVNDLLRFTINITLLDHTTVFSRSVIERLKLKVTRYRVTTDFSERILNDNPHCTVFVNTSKH